MMRVCPKRDGLCPHGMDCPYMIDRYNCREETSPTRDPGKMVQPGEAEAWRFRYKSGTADWDRWIVVMVDPNDWDWAPTWTDFQCESLYPASALSAAYARGVGDSARVAHSFDQRTDITRIMGYGVAAAIRALLLEGEVPAAHPDPDEDTGKMLERLRDDAAAWASEFRATAIRLGYSDMDEGWLIGWFANAIENTEVVRRKSWAQASDGWNHDMDAAPRDGTPVLVAVLLRDETKTVVGEAHYEDRGPTDGDTGWWWAGTSPGDEYAEPIAGWHFPPTAWRPLPAPPTGGN